MKLTAQQLRDLNQENYENLPENLDGWYMRYDDETGSFDPEKGAMYDFLIYLYDEDGNKRYEGVGGWSHQGVSFNRDIEFEDITDRPETEVYQLTDLEVRTIIAMIECISNGNIGAEALEGYEDLTAEEAWAGLESLNKKF